MKQLRMLVKKTNRLLKNRTNRKLAISGLALVVVGLSWAALSLSLRADTLTTASFQAEAGTKTGVTTISDASAAGGSAVQFGVASTGGFKANCIVKPSDCGYPDETNTGVPAGTVLTNSGSITVTQNGAIIENKNVTGQIIIRANNVTIRKTRIVSGDYYPIDYNGDNTGLLVEDTEIRGTSSNVTASLSFTDYIARRVYAHGAADGMKADSNVLIEDSYITGLAIGDGTHNDGIQTTGGSNVTVRHNTFKLGNQSGVSAVIQMGTEWGPNSNWLVENNLIDGGGWSINAGSQNNTMRYLNNRFTRNAGYGTGHPSGSIWTGNYYDNDGTTVN